MSILNPRNSILILALIAVAIGAGNFLVNRSGPASAAGQEPVEAGLVSSESSTLLAFNMGGEVDQLRLEEAAIRLRRVADRRAKDRAVGLAKKKLKTKYRNLPGSVSRETLDEIADCESGGDPDVVSSNGLYHGKYQFSPGTWESVGGEGLPSKASEAEQDYRAGLLYERSGPGQWPVCGH